MQSTGVRTRDRQKLVLLAAQFSVGSQQRGIGQHGENEKNQDERNDRGAPPPMIAHASHCTTIAPAKWS
jgi:hypothetical protein